MNNKNNGSILFPVIYCWPKILQIFFKDKGQEKDSFKLFYGHLQLSKWFLGPDYRLKMGRDEKSVKRTSTGVNGRRPSTSRKAQSVRRRPLENLSLVDVYKRWLSTIDVDKTELFCRRRPWKAQSGWRRRSTRRGFLLVDGWRQADSFITPLKMSGETKKIRNK